VEKKNHIIEGKKGLLQQMQELKERMLAERQQINKVKYSNYGKTANSKGVPPHSTT
jgi:hypothetical protein